MMTAAGKAKHLNRLILLGFAGLVWLMPGTAVRAEPVTVRTAVLELNPTAPPEQRGESKLGRLDYLGGLILASEEGNFGGYSGIAVDADGAGLLAIADTGHWLRLDFRRDD